MLEVGEHIGRKGQVVAVAAFQHVVPIAGNGKIKALELHRGGREHRRTLIGESPLLIIIEVIDGPDDSVGVLSIADVARVRYRR